MPALNFKSRFAELVATGAKTHTIRAWRRRPFKRGDVLMFYTGMRTKACRKIRPDLFCTAATPIEVNAARHYIILSEGSLLYPAARLDYGTVEELAFLDGFGSSRELFDFFQETHGSILCGQLVEWQWMDPAKK